MKMISIKPTTFLEFVSDNSRTWDPSSDYDRSTPLLSHGGGYSLMKEGRFA